MAQFLSFFQNLYLQAPSATRWIAVLSLFVGIGGLGIAWARSIHLHLATQKLKMVLKVLRLKAIEPAGTEEANELDRVWAEIQGLRIPRALRDGLNRLEMARTRPIGLPEDAWRGAYEQILSAESRWETLVRGLASAAVLVGLLGTIVGFADISGDLPFVSGAATIRSASPEGGTSAAKGSIPAKLGGVFIATISGILAALLILILGVPVLRSVADRWLTAVEDTGRLIVVPALPRPPTRIQDALIEELERRISSVAEAWESSLRGPAASLAETAENSRRSVEAATRAFDGLRVSVEDLKELGRSARRIREAAQSIEGTAKVYVDASNRLGGAVGRLEATLPSLSEDLKLLAPRLAALEGVLESGTRTVSQSGEGLREAVGKMSSEFHGLQKAVGLRHEQETSFLERTEQTFALIEERITGLDAVEQVIKAEAQEMNKAVASVALAVGKALDPLRDNISEAIRDTWGKLLADHEGVLAVSILQIRQESAEMVRLLEKIRSAQEGLFGSHQSLTASATFLAERGKELDSIAERLGGVLEAFNRLSASVDSLARSGLVAHAEPGLVTALTEAIEESRARIPVTMDGTKLAALLTGIQQSMFQMTEEVSRLRNLAERLQQERDNTFFRKIRARLRPIRKGVPL